MYTGFQKEHILAKYKIIMAMQRQKNNNNYFLSQSDENRQKKLTLKYIIKYILYNKK